MTWAGVVLKVPGLLARRLGLGLGLDSARVARAVVQYSVAGVVAEDHKVHQSMSLAPYAGNRFATHRGKP